MINYNNKLLTENGESKVVSEFATLVQSRPKLPVVKNIKNSLIFFSAQQFLPPSKPKFKNSPTALWRRHAQKVRDRSSSYKIDYVIVIRKFLDHEGHQNPISGSKVTDLLLKGGFCL